MWSCEQSDFDCGLDPIQAMSIYAKACGVPWDANGGRLSSYVNWTEYGYQQITPEEPYKLIFDDHYNRGVYSRRRGNKPDFFIKNNSSKDCICSIATTMFFDFDVVEQIVFSKRAVKHIEKILMSYGMVKVDSDGYRPGVPIFGADYCYVFPDLPSVGVICKSDRSINPETRELSIEYYTFSTYINLDAINLCQSEFFEFEDFHRAINNAPKFREQYKNKRINVCGYLMAVTDIGDGEYNIYICNSDGNETIVFYCDDMISDNLLEKEIGDIVYVAGNIVGILPVGNGVEIEYAMIM